MVVSILYRYCYTNLLSLKTTSITCSQFQYIFLMWSMMWAFSHVRDYWMTHGVLVLFDWRDWRARASSIYPAHSRTFGVVFDGGRMRTVTVQSHWARCPTHVPCATYNNHTNKLVNINKNDNATWKFDTPVFKYPIMHTIICIYVFL